MGLKSGVSVSLSARARLLAGVCVRLLACKCARSFACWQVCAFVCLLASVRVCLLACLQVCACLLACKCVRLLACKCVRLLACECACLPGKARCARACGVVCTCECTCLDARGFGIVRARASACVRDVMRARLCSCACVSAPVCSGTRVGVCEPFMCTCVSVGVYVEAFECRPSYQQVGGKINATSQQV